MLNNEHFFFPDRTSAKSEIRRYSTAGEQKVVQTDEPNTHRFLKTSRFQHRSREKTAKQREVL